MDNIIKLFESKYPDKKVTAIGKVGNTYGIIAPSKASANADINNVEFSNPFYKVNGNTITHGDPFVDDKLFGSLQPVK